MDPFVGEIRMLGSDFAPAGWATCDGQLLPLNQNTALFSLLGTTYGGNGKDTFALPDLQASMPMGSADFGPGEVRGTPSVTLLVSEIPTHKHGINAFQDDLADVSTPGPGVILGASKALNLYGSASDTTLNPGALAPTGQSAPHNNLSPYLVVNFCIAMKGVFPPRG